MFFKKKHETGTSYYFFGKYFMFKSEGGYGKTKAYILNVRLFRKTFIIHFHIANF